MKRIPFTDLYIIRKSDLEKIMAKARLLNIRLTDKQIEDFIEGRSHFARNPKRKAA